MGEKEAEQNIKWIDHWDKEGPDEEGIYFITRGNPPFVEEAAYDPKAGEFVGYYEDDYIVAWSPDPIEMYKGDGSKSDEDWSVYPDELPEEDTTLLVTCENTTGNRFIQYAIFWKGKFTVLDSYVWLRKPFLRVVAWRYLPAPYKGRT